MNFEAIAAFLLTNLPAIIQAFNTAITAVLDAIAAMSKKDVTASDVQAATDTMNTKVSGAIAVLQDHTAQATSAAQTAIAALNAPSAQGDNSGG